MNAQEKLLQHLVDSGPASLGPERRAGAKTVQELTIEVERIFADKSLNLRHQNAILSLVLLWNDHLEESHSISQNISNADGSYIHGLMHRREPDYGNAKYWFHRVGNHSSFPELRFAAEKMRLPNNLSQVHANHSWNPFAFIDAIAATNSQTEPLLRQLQQMEFICLFNHILGEALKTGG